MDEARKAVQNLLDIKELEKIMTEYGLIIRAIPFTTTSILETCHADAHPNGAIEYIPEYQRDMLVVRQRPKHAGKFLVESCQNTTASIKFHGKTYFDTIEAATDSIRKKRTESQ